MALLFSPAGVDGADGDASSVVLDPGRRRVVRGVGEADGAGEGSQARLFEAIHGGGHCACFWRYFARETAVLNLGMKLFWNFAYFCEHLMWSWMVGPRGL